MSESERSESYGAPMSGDDAAELEQLRREAAALREQLENAVGSQSGLRSARDVHQLEARIDSLAARNSKLMETLKEARQQLLALHGRCRECSAYSWLTIERIGYRCSQVSRLYVAGITNGSPVSRLQIVGTITNGQMRSLAARIVQMKNDGMVYLLFHTKVPLRVIRQRILVEQTTDARAGANLNSRGRS